MPLMTWALPEEAPRARMPLLKKLFWAYFLLLFFEGALRKWIVPQLSLELLLIRDPIALAILWEAYRTRRWPREWAQVVGVLTLVLFLLSLLQIVASGLTWFIALYGLRSYVLPFPVAFIMGANLDREDLKKFAKCLLWLMLPLTALQIAQYYAPPDSLLNKGAFLGVSQIGYSGSHVRASATFSFVTGPMHYLPLAAAFILFSIVNPSFLRNRLLVWLSSAALVVAIPMTGSRTVVYTLAALVVCASVAAFSGLSEMAGAMKITIAMCIVAALVSQLPMFSDAIETMSKRFTEASHSEGDTESVMKVRVLGPIAGAVDNALSSGNWLGMGMGYGSNLAARTITGDTTQFLAGENEWPRVISEFGPVLGIGFMLFRVVLALSLASRALACVREREPLGWFLVAATIPALVFETLEQPTIQGFFVITLGFMIAALNRENFGSEDMHSYDLPLNLRRFGVGAR